MNLSWLNPFNAIGETVVKGIKIVKGDQSARDGYAHDENSAVLGQFAAEFAPKTKRTWFDSLIDGINRLPRPTMAMGVIALFAYAPVNPGHFAEIMASYTLVPPWLAGTLTAVVGFYFTYRHLEKRLDFKPVDVGRLRSVLNLHKELRQASEPISAEQFEKEMRDTSEPLSNAAIDEWNRRRKR